MNQYIQEIVYQANRVRRNKSVLEDRQVILSEKRAMKSASLFFGAATHLVAKMMKSQ
ncbi:hypothetical protein [Scatolibacter rhodanostii]|uniref:hypothetical protein n=1 Tax=Scatolibacter rhodanostii TaxID=2014781 RepID=UPI0013566CC5|nr:hypothetical protein [Scatolibacter rhodanostii]